MSNLRTDGNNSTDNTGTTQTTHITHNILEAVEVAFEQDQENFSKHRDHQYTETPYHVSHFTASMFNTHSVKLLTWMATTLLTDILSRWDSPWGNQIRKQNSQPIKTILQNGRVSVRAKLLGTSSSGERAWMISLRVPQYRLLTHVPRRQRRETRKLSQQTSIVFLWAV